VGRQVWLNGVPVTVVGVAERSFTGIEQLPPVFWVPFAAYPALSGGKPLTRESTQYVDVVGRTPAGARLPQAEAELSAVAAALGRNSQDPYRPTGVHLESARSMRRPSDTKIISLVVAIVLTVVGLVMLLACVNVANLQLASAIERQREIGVRLALGATRARLVRQLVTESLVLGLAAGVIGLLATVWLVPTLASVVQLPVTVDASPDVRVYLFLAVLSLAAGIGAGLAPARHGTRGDLMTPLKGDGPGVGSSGRPSRLRAALIGVQAASSFVLLVAAALLTRAAVRATQVDLGFDAQHLVAITAAFGRGNYDEVRARAYWDLALERIRAVPGVRAAALADAPPYLGYGVFTLSREGRQYRTSLNRTSADYFSTVGLRVVRGRTYTPQEVAAGAPVAVINETLAREFWPGADPIGSSVETFDRKTRSTVIGIVSDSITARLRELRPATMYWPLTAAVTGRIVVRTNAQPETVVPSLRAVVQPLDPRVRLDIALVAEGLEKELDQPRILASLSGGLAALALGLALVGIYGVTSFVTGQRTREIGVRIAVGATAGDVMRLLLADSLRPVSIGLGVGVVVALFAGRLLTGILYGIQALDPAAFAGAVIVLFTSSAVAVYIPTRRAARVDPVCVLRQS
jgi:predicted permease